MNSQHPSVEKLFQEQLEYYSASVQSATTSPIISLFLDWAKTQNNQKLAVCEFGGSAGQLLTKIQQKFPNFSYTNVEIIERYRKKQISKKIKFVHGSILASHFPEKSFDGIVIRDVLHHLIGKDLQKTLRNQKKALQEIYRLLRPGGRVFIEELVNESALASKIIYGLSKLNSKIGIRITSLEISPHTITYFLTAKKLLLILESIFGKRNIAHLNFVEESDLKTKLVHLGVGCGKMFIAAGKNARSPF